MSIFSPIQWIQLTIMTILRNFRERQHIVHLGSQFHLEFHASPSRVFATFLALGKLLKSVEVTKFDRIVQYLGPLQLHFIKESWTVRGEGLLGSFLHRFITEVDAATRAQVFYLESLLDLIYFPIGCCFRWKCIALSKVSANFPRLR